MNEIEIDTQIDKVKGILNNAFDTNKEAGFLLFTVNKTNEYNYRVLCESTPELASHMVLNSIENSEHLFQIFLVSIFAHIDNMDKKNKGFKKDMIELLNMENILK